MDLKALVAAVDIAALNYGAKKDLVRWTAFAEDGTEFGKWNSTACYSGIMQKLPEMEIHCLPFKVGVRERMPAPWYFHFFSLLKKSGLVPTEVQNMHRNRANCMIIPRTGWDRHTLYITLCSYRLTEVRPLEAMRIMLLYKRLASQGTTFLQCLHYGLTVSKLGTGHSYLDFGLYGAADKHDLAYGIALANFARMSKKARLKATPAPAQPNVYSTDRYTYTFLSKRAKKLESIKVEDQVEILNPKYAHLYQKPKKEAKKDEASGT